MENISKAWVAEIDEAVAKYKAKFPPRAMVGNPQLLAKKDLKDGCIAALNKINVGEAPCSNNERPS
eukprot:7510333-Lingulodinium_polyedra.AAC.1